MSTSKQAYKINKNNKINYCKMLNVKTNSYTEYNVSTSKQAYKINKNNKINYCKMLNVKTNSMLIYRPHVEFLLAYACTLYIHT